MRYLKKYNESNDYSISDDFMTDDFMNTLNDILLEYNDNDISYTFRMIFFRKHSGGYLPIKTFIPNGNNQFDFEKIKQENTFSDVIGYQICFKETLTSDLFASNIQRGDNRKLFLKPNKEIYNFFEITKEIQYIIESMGYIFLLSTSQEGEFDIMVINDKL